jgi:hypothetical protein
MVAIAAGTTSRVAEWTALLSKRRIRYVTAESCGMTDEASPDYVELWVQEKTQIGPETS